MEMQPQCIFTGEKIQWNWRPTMTFTFVHFWFYCENRCIFRPEEYKKKVAEYVKKYATEEALRDACGGEVSVLYSIIQSNVHKWQNVIKYCFVLNTCVSDFILEISTCLTGLTWNFWSSLTIYKISRENVLPVLFSFLWRYPRFHVCIRAPEASAMYMVSSAGFFGNVDSSNTW